MLIGVLVAAAYRGVILAWADIEYRRGTLVGISRAESLVPSNPLYHYVRALMLQQAEPGTPEIENELGAAVTNDPRYSDALLEWSVVKELHGDVLGAERLLVQAEKTDHLLRPAWALASFYSRQGMTNKLLTWSFESLRIIGVTGVSEDRFSPYPIFKLLWMSDAKRDEILENGLPPIRSILDFYLGFVASTGDLTAAQAVADRLLPEARLGTGDELFIFPYVNTLIEHKQVELASKVWSQLFRSRMVPYPGPDTARGIFITNGDFRSSPLNFGFGWHYLFPESVQFFADKEKHSYRFEFDGSGTEAFGLLTQTVLLIPNRTYEIAVASQSDFDPDKSGLSWKLTDRLSGKDLLKGRVKRNKTENGRKVFIEDFSAPLGCNSADLALVYVRQPGTVRLRGSYEIFKVTAKLLLPATTTH